RGGRGRLPRPPPGPRLPDPRAGLAAGAALRGPAGRLRPAPRSPRRTLARARVLVRHGAPEVCRAPAAGVGDGGPPAAAPGPGRRRRAGPPAPRAEAVHRRPRRRRLVGTGAPRGPRSVGAVGPGGCGPRRHVSGRAATTLRATSAPIPAATRTQAS